MAISEKPTVADLGVDPDAQAWQRSGAGEGALEVAFVLVEDARWVLLRVAGDPADRVLVYNQHEWECFLDGVRGGEFDGAGSG
jgi:hypothetical protein